MWQDITKKSFKWLRTAFFDLTNTPQTAKRTNNIIAFNKYIMYITVQSFGIV
jgi:hypothetical protein